MAKLILYAERIFLTLLSASIIYRLVPHVTEHPQIALFLFSELVGVILILSQRRGDATTAPMPVIIAFICTGIGLLVLPTGAQLVSDAVSSFLVFSGAAIALGAKLSLRRSFGIVPANRGVKRGGLYRLVRHPMYSGYIINQAGFLLLYFSAWNVAIYAVAWMAFWIRACEEEKFLSQDPDYRDYASHVKSRLLPGLV
jgi:protein-S-isoprenylcysteine O-methyltransferase Ste14